MNALLVDFGSTFTKVRVLDLGQGRLVGSAQAPTTVATDVTLGLRAALATLPPALSAGGFDDHLKLACSSAAGGLRIVAVGLIRELTAEAATRAALGAGGKIVATIAGGLSRGDVAELEADQPDIIVLSGGTDGGNDQCLLASAGRIAASNLACPVIVAGNRLVRDDAVDLLVAGGKAAVPAGNVLPAIGELAVDGCREAIRTVFLDRIVHAKGLDRAEQFIGRVAMPTPEAVLLGCEILAEALSDEAGEVRDLVCVDVGGATTDVYSVGSGAPTETGAVLKGLPEPYIKRTVEGDLGLRINAASIAELVGEARVQEAAGVEIDVGAAVAVLQSNPETLPHEASLRQLDVALAYWATHVGVRRHAGTREVVYGAMGPTVVQVGKDLRKVATVVGTGGIFGAGAPEDVLRILRGATHPSGGGGSLVPVAPDLFIDSTYSLFAAGLLATVDRDAAKRFARQMIVGHASVSGRAAAAV